MSSDLRAKTLFIVKSTGDFIYSPQNTRFRMYEELHFLPDELSRSFTPAEDESSTPIPEIQTITYLRFTVDNIGDQTSFVFGSDPETCDVYVYAAQKISRRIFAIELENHGTTAMLKNLSTHGIDIESAHYQRQRIRSKRALPQGDKVAIFLPGFNIEVQFLDHSDHGDLHKFYLEQLRPRFDLAVPRMNQLGLDSIPESSASSRRKNPYQLQGEIGSGDFGTVYRALNSYSGALVAIKKFHKRSSKHPIEAKVLENLSHPNIVKFIDYISPAGEPPMLVMEIIDGRNLEQEHQRSPLLVDETRDLMSELLYAVDYLHGEEITHRDLKPNNIIIVERESMCIKITDFGLARPSGQLKTFCGTHTYAAPEIYKGSYGNEVDMWSVGVIALELAVGLPDYPKNRRNWPDLLMDRLKASAKFSQVHPYVYYPLPPLFYEFVKSLLHVNAVQRPSAREWRRHQFLQIGSYFTDASPTERAPTPPEYRDQYVPPLSSSLHRGAPSQAVPARVPGTVYTKLKYGKATVTYRPDDGLINVTQLLKAVKHKRQMTWATLEAKIGGMNRSVVANRKIHGSCVGGSYVPLADADRILQHLRLPRVSIQVLSGQIHRKD